MRRLLEKAGFSKLSVFTSPRHANGNFVGSWSIKRSGHFAMGTQQPVSARLLGRVVQVAASAIHRMRPELGEDLVAVAEK